MRVALLYLCLAVPVAAQPASDLLQSGIFYQESAGDLETAIRLYRQVLASPDLHLYAAQAQFRLGVCLLRKGDIAGATEALQTVIRNYPQERELVARARENMPGGDALLPVPWSETEVAEYRWNIPNVDDGWSLMRVAPAVNRQNLRIQMNMYSPRPYTTMVDVERGAMRPIHAKYQPPNQPVLSSGAARHKGASNVYEYGEVLYLLRRMPLYVGWSGSIPVMAPDRARVDLNVSVVGTETLTVAAGKFPCVKVLLTADPKGASPTYSAAGTAWPLPVQQQVLWYAVDGARPLVRLQVFDFTGELTSLRTGEQLGSTSFRDPVIGYSFTVPAGWVYHARAAFAGEATSVDLLDPELQTFVTISAKAKRTDPAKIESELIAGALETQAQRLQLVTRGALEHGKIGGHASLGWIGERTGAEGKSIRYTVWIQSESTRASIAAAVPAEEFDRFRPRFEAIVNSFRMP